VLNACAATLRIADREPFLFDVHRCLAGLGRAVTDDDISGAIERVLGIVPFRTHVFLRDGVNKQTKEQTK
jgi:hypothetical protein